MSDTRDEALAATLLAAAQSIAQLKMESIALRIVVAALLRETPERQSLLHAIEDIAARTTLSVLLTIFVYDAAYSGREIPSHTRIVKNAPKHLTTRAKA